jgi:RNA polymerase sigma-70 factor (ECF subfamily)
MTARATGGAMSLSELLRRAGAGDAEARGELFARHRARLRRMVELRMDWRLRGRLDPSDILQDAYLEFTRSLPAYLREPAAPFYIWLRFVTGRKLLALHRHHLGTRIRDAGREVSLDRQAQPPAGSLTLAAQILGRFSTPSQAALRAERRRYVREALDAMEPLDREVLTLRHFEQLSNSEAAAVLGISEAAASNRFVRALKRLKDILLGVPGLIDDPAAGGAFP